MEREKSFCQHFSALYVKAAGRRPDEGRCRKEKILTVTLEKKFEGHNREYVCKKICDFPSRGITHEKSAWHVF